MQKSPLDSAKHVKQTLTVKMPLPKRDIKAVEKTVIPLTNLIAEARAKVKDAGGKPNVIYIPDVFPRKKDEIRMSAMQVDTGCRIFGMKIIADYRVPKNNFYIMQGEL